MRQLPIEHRESLMGKIRNLMSNKTFCPFFFQYDFARVLSGEEEAAFSWTAVNFLMGALLPHLSGTGDVITPSIDTFGTVDLGGASTQISFFVPSQDISDGLFKLQIGSQRHWNIYVKSFLQFGYNSAQLRHFTDLANYGYQNNDKHVVDNCLFSGYDYPTKVTDSTGTFKVSIRGPDSSSKKQFSNCYDSLRSLMLLGSNTFCDFAFHGECSMNGAYQPQLPVGANGHFLGTSTFKYPWSFLNMPPTATLKEFSKKVEWLCSLTYSELLDYNKNNNYGIKNSQHTTLLPNYCYMSSYILILLKGISIYSYKYFYI